MKYFIGLVVCILFFQVANAQTSTKKAMSKPAAKIFMAVERMPEYVGGEAAMMEFIKKEIKYPTDAREAHIEGVVYIAFVVAKEGDVIGVKILKDIGGGCGQEAARVVDKMPKWIPGTNNGEPVNVEYTIPVDFSLKK